MIFHTRKMRFSIIIPVYNVEKYLERCLDSVINQTYKNFEAIVVNDGSTDSSQEIIDKYSVEYKSVIKSFYKENGGLSDARNFGIEKAKGEYLIFLDSDDCIDLNYLEVFNKEIEKYNDIDLIRVPKKISNTENGDIKVEEFLEKSMSGEEAFCYMRKEKICIETACSYCVKTSFWKNNNFIFPKGGLHEDFAIMLMVVLKANRVSFSNDTYYNYIIRENSIMTNKNYEKEVKKVYDKLSYYDNYVKELNKVNNEISDETKCIFMEYISTAILEGLKKIKGKELKEYKNEVKKRCVLKNIKEYKNISFKIIAKKIFYSMLILK